MLKGHDNYLREIQKFVTSQYWNSGVRITAGVVVPLFVLVYLGRLNEGMPFLWGALFVSITDTPGPVHHRRNGMIAAILLNTAGVLLTQWTKDYQLFLIFQIVSGGFLLSMLGIYGARAGAVGVLALIIILLNLLSDRQDREPFLDPLLVFSGGTWYMLFSLLLYRIKPYRIVEQALGEQLIAIADYLRARAALYKPSADIPKAFEKVMEAQSTVRKIQEQCQELLFNTRRFVTDPSPKSRTSMMIFLQSQDLLEETMFSYQDYAKLQQGQFNTDLLPRLYGVIFQVAAALEHVGIRVQSGLPVRNHANFSDDINLLRGLVKLHHQHDPDMTLSLQKTINGLTSLVERINLLIHYSRVEAHAIRLDETDLIARKAVSQPLRADVFIENLSWKSENFRHAIRLTISMMGAYAVSVTFSIDQPYWVLLTLVTIMKPFYSVTRKRNIERVLGTLAGVVLVFSLLYLVSSDIVLLILMIFSMLVGYSLLRVNYFGFVVFLTMFVILSFHFTNPFNIREIIVERLVDTVIGSVIAFFASRFIFPVWGHEKIQDRILEMLRANRNYFLTVWQTMKMGHRETLLYESARRNAVVTLTNLSDEFQQMLEEPEKHRGVEAIHQFVIASHLLIGYIAALPSDNRIRESSHSPGMENAVRLIEASLDGSEQILLSAESVVYKANAESREDQVIEMPSQLLLILSVAREIHPVVGRIYSMPETGQ